MNISEELKRQAVSLNLCQEWTDEWKSWEDKQALIDKYLRGIDFCIKHDYPTLSYIKENFEKELLAENRIFADEDLSLNNMSGVYVLLGKCTGSLEIGGFGVCTIYVRHESDVKIRASKLANVFVNVHDRGKVEVEQIGCSKAYVYMHGGECVAKCSGDVVVRQRKK